MSDYVDLPCGCRINDAFVMHMCHLHYLDLQGKRRESKEAMRKFELLMDAQLKAAIQGKSSG